MTADYLIHLAGVVASRLAPDGDPVSVLTGNIPDDRLLALAFWELTSRYVEVRDALETAIRPPKTHRCAWCFRAAGATDEAWRAMELMDFAAAGRHTLTCEHNPLVRRVKELEAVADEALVYWLSLDARDVGRVGQLRELLEKRVVMP